MQLPGIMLSLAGIGGAIFLLNQDEIKIPDLGMKLPQGAMSSIRDTVLPVGNMGGDSAAAYDPADPSTLVREERMGKIIASPGMALIGGGVLVASDAIDGFQPTRDTDRPAALSTLAAENCALSRPNPQDFIANILVGENSGMPVPIQAFATTEAASSALYVLRRDKKNHGRTVGKSFGTAVNGQMRVVDVVVARSDRPVYLILQNQTDGIVWNIHPAPGTTIARITLVATGDAGLVNPDPDVPVQVARAGQNADCAPPPWPRPRANSAFFKEMQEIGQYDETMQKFTDRFDTYNTWFRGAFGFEADIGLIGEHGVNHVLVGDLPAADAKAPYRPFTGATVALLAQDNTYIASLREHNARFVEVLTELMIAALGAPLESLTPVAMERGQ